MAEKRPIDAATLEGIRKHAPILRSAGYELRRAATYLEQWSSQTLEQQPLLNVNALLDGRPHIKHESRECTSFCVACCWKTCALETRCAIREHHPQPASSVCSASATILDPTPNRLRPLGCRRHVLVGLLCQTVWLRLLVVVALARLQRPKDFRKEAADYAARAKKAIVLRAASAAWADGVPGRSITDCGGRGGCS